MADWLVHQVTQMVAVNPANLVVIDGAGDLAPKLKRKAVVTRLLGEQLAYVGMDGVSRVAGCLPGSCQCAQHPLGIICLSNAPLFDGAITVLVENHAQHVAELIQRFQADDLLLVENMHLLGRGEGVILSIFVAWDSDGEKARF